MSTARMSGNLLRTRRITFPKRVAIRPRDGTGVNQDQVVDLSLGGMFVSTFLPMEAGEVVDFEMEIAQMRFTGAGRVVWTRSNGGGEDEPAGVAVEFVDLTPGQRRLLHLEITDYLKSGGKLKIGSPPNSGAAGRTSAARKNARSQASRGGLFRRIASKLGL